MLQLEMTDPEGRVLTVDLELFIVTSVEGTKYLADYKTDDRCVTSQNQMDDFDAILAAVQGRTPEAFFNYIDSAEIDAYYHVYLYVNDDGIFYLATQDEMRDGVTITNPDFNGRAIISVVPGPGTTELDNVVIGKVDNILFFTKKVSYCSFMIGLTDVLSDNTVHTGIMTEILAHNDVAAATGPQKHPVSVRYLFEGNEVTITLCYVNNVRYTVSVIFTEELYSAVLDMEEL